MMDASGLDERDRVILEHYSRFLGPASQTWTFDDGPEAAPRPIRVVEFAPLSEDYDWMYLTLGMSREPMPRAPRPEHRIELLMYSQQHPDLTNILRQLAVYPFHYETLFGPGDTIAGRTGEGVAKNSPLTDFLLTPAYFEAEGIDLFELPGGDHVQVLWATPIAPSERAFIRKYGWRALVEGPFIDQAVEPANLWRQPVV